MEIFKNKRINHMKSIATAFGGGLYELPQMGRITPPNENMSNSQKYMNRDSPKEIQSEPKKKMCDGIGIDNMVPISIAIYIIK